MKQLRVRFGDLPESVLERVHACADADLERWAERILSAASLEDVLA